MSDWYFLATHGLVLICIARQPEITAREIANTIGITERTTHKIITDLHNAEYLEKQKAGRRNTYQLDLSRPLRHPILRDPTADGNGASVGDLLRAVGAIQQCDDSEGQGPPGTPPSAVRGGLRRIFRRDGRPQSDETRHVQRPAVIKSNPLHPALIGFGVNTLPGVVA